MKGARPVWPVEATGNPPQPTGTAALVYWAPWSSEAITHGATKWRRRNGIRGSRPVSPPFGLSLFLEAASFYISVLPDAGRAGRCVKQSRIRLSSEGVGWRGGGGGKGRAQTVSRSQDVLTASSPLHSPRLWQLSPVSGRPCLPPAPGKGFWPWMLFGPAALPRDLPLPSGRGPGPAPLGTAPASRAVLSPCTPAFPPARG